MTTNPTNGSTLEIAQSNQDLIITKGKKKKRAWIIGGAVVLVALAVIIALAVVLTGDPQSLSLTQNIPAITLEDVLEGKTNPKGFNATWISGDELIFRERNGAISKFNVAKRSVEEILSPNTPILLTAFEYELSPDKQYLLIAHDYQKLYRYSYVAQYSVVNIKTGAVSRILAGAEVVLQYAMWSPVGNALIYVSHYNIFYRPSAASTQFAAITQDGVQGHIYNGVPDWVYEEEVFSSNRAIWVSPDGMKLSYAKFNDTQVPIMNIPVYGQPGSWDFQYTRGIQIRYPKPGTKNPIVSLHVVDLKMAKQTTVEPPFTLSGPPILSAVVWPTNDDLVAIWMNRIQNEATIMSYSINDLVNVKVKYLTEPRGWLELFTPPMFNKNGDEMLLILSQKQNGSKSSFRHITKLQRKEDGQSEAITKGLFVVTEILKWDEDKNVIYYQATDESDPAIQHVYSVSTQTKKITCLSCGAKNSLRKSDCLHNTATFSKDSSHYVLHCAGPDVPEVAIYSLDGKKLYVWEENTDLVALVQEKQIPISKRFKFEVPGGHEAQVILKLPPNMDTSGNTKYPMLIHVYGGPDSYQVVQKFALDWGGYLAANKSIIYGLIDGRGSGLKGDDILFSVYKQLGTVEVIDHINVTRRIQQTLPYVDATRTAIWGWSYGGYASGMALAMDDSNVFKCGISVAPVTDWGLYDSIYTERFMGLPKENPEAYTRARLLNKYEGIRNKQYYLIHGTLDDNVHYQQSMLWSKVLEERDIIFRQQSYPDEDHGLISVRPHLYHSLESFLDECFVVENK